MEVAVGTGSFSRSRGRFVEEWWEGAREGTAVVAEEVSSWLGVAFDLGDRKSAKPIVKVGC